MRKSKYFWTVGALISVTWTGTSCALYDAYQDDGAEAELLDDVLDVTGEPDGKTDIREDDATPPDNRDTRDEEDAGDIDRDVDDEDAQNADPLRWEAVSVGHNFTLAAFGGRLYSWGMNGTEDSAGWTADGRLGLNTSEDKFVVRSRQIAGVEGPPGWFEAPGRVSAGASGACALARGPEGLCWGQNDQFQIGLNLGGAPLPKTPIFQPQSMGNEVSFLKLYTRQGLSCGIAADQVAYCAGENNFGQRGYLPPENSTGGGHGSSSAQWDSPIKSGRQEILRFEALALGSQHACGLSADKARIYCWGSNEFNQLGVVDDDHIVANDGRRQQHAHRAVAVAFDEGIQGFEELVAGHHHTCARTVAGEVYCWGDNRGGQLGSELAEVTAPLKVEGVSGSNLLSAGADITCVQRENDPSGALAECWGKNEFGQFGNGGVSSSRQPQRQQIHTPAGSIWKQLSISESHACGLLDDGVIYCWGNNGGEKQLLGVGSTDSHVTVPRPIQNLPAELLDNGDP